MKKILFLLLASFLVLAACGNKEESKSDDSKETKSSSNKKSNDEKNDIKQSEDSKDKSNDSSNDEVTKQNEINEQPVQSQEQVNTQKQQMTQQHIQSQEKAEQSESEQQQNSQVANKEQSNVPAGDAMFGEYKKDGTYCTVGGCLTPEQQKDQEEANYEEMENQGYSREEYDEIQNKAAELQQQRDNGEISSEEFTDSYLELYD